MSPLNRPLTENEQSVVRTLEATDPERASEYLKNLALLDEHRRLHPPQAPKKDLSNVALIAALLAAAALVYTLTHDWRSPEDKKAYAARAEEARVEKIIEDSKSSKTPESSPISKSQAKDVVKVAINLNGYLCADIISAAPLANNKARVTCVEHQDGTGQVTYIVDIGSGATVKE